MRPQRGRGQDRDDRPTLLVAVTAPMSARALLRGQLRHFHSCGYRVVLVCSPGPGLADTAAREDVEVVPVDMARAISLRADLLALWRLFRVMRSTRPAITNVGTPKAGLLAGLAAWLARVPCRIYTLRGLRLETATGAQRVLLYLTEWIACRVAHTVVCVSPSLRRRALGLRLMAPDRAVVLGNGSSNGIDVDRFVPTDERRAVAARMRAELDVPEGAPVVGFVGRLTRAKGLVELVEAYRGLLPSFPDLRLLLLGEPEPGDPLPPTTLAALETLPGILRPGFVGDTARWYHLMDVVVLPTHREGFPNVLLEAAAAGKPVVTTDATGAVDAVVDDVTGRIVPTGDVRALHMAIGSLLAAPDAAARMGRRGQERVSNHFRSRVVWRALGGLYDGLLGASGTSGPHLPSTVSTVRPRRAVRTTTETGAAR